MEADARRRQGELSSCGLQLAAYDRGRFGPHMLIGTIDLDLDSIYSMPGHELWRSWLTLSDPRGKREGPQGMVMACITVLGRNDKPGDHSGDAEDAGLEIDLGGDAGGLDLSMLGVRKEEKGVVTREEYGIRLQVFMARDLPKMDWGAPGAGVSPFVQLVCGSKKVATRRRRSKDPQWRQEIGMNVNLPPGAVGAAPVRIQMLNKEFTSKDKPIAAFGIPFQDLLGRPEYYATPRWYTLYGAPREPEEELHLRKGSKLARRMNCGFVEGSTYRGQLYMSISAGRSGELPPIRRRAIAMTDPKPPANYVLLCEVLSLDMPYPEEGGMGSEVMVEMTYALTSVRTAMWYEAKGMRDSGGDVFITFGEKLKPTNVLIPHPLEGQDAGTGAPDVFLNVWWNKPEKHRVAYGRVRMSHLLPALMETEFPEEGPEGAAGGRFAFQGWLPLRADSLSLRKGSTTVRSTRPQGAILVRLQLTRKTGGKPYIVGVTAAEEEERRLEEEKKKLKLEGALEDSDEDEEEEKKKKAREKKKKSEAPGIFEPGGAFGATPDPEVVQPFATRPFKLRVFLYQAIGIPASDATGASDPFCVVRCGRSSSRTQVCAATTSPAWFAEVVLEVLLPVCSRPDMMSFGVMVQNAKHVERARRQLTASLYKPEPRHPVKGEDLPPMQLPDVITGGRLVSRGGLRNRNAPALAHNDEHDVRRPGAPPPTVLGAEVEDEMEDVLGDVPDGEVLWWACPTVHMTVYDKGTLHDTQLSIGQFPLSRMGGKEATGGYDESHQLSKSVALRWYPLRAFEFADARKNVAPDGGGGHVLAAFSLEGPMDSAAAVLDRRKAQLAEAKKLPPIDSTFEPACAPLLGGKAAGKSSLGVYGIQLDCMPVEMEVMLLGVRGLLPLMGLPIVAPAVEVELTGVLPVLRSRRVTATSKHSSRPNGPNANYSGEVLAIRAKFPSEPKVQPGLTLRVRDKRLGVSPIVGIASLAALPQRTPGPSAAELEAENDAWAFMGPRMGSEGTLSTASIRSGLSSLSGTDHGDGKPHAGHKEKKAGDDDDDDVGPPGTNGGAGDGYDPHGTGDTPAYLVGREVLSTELEDKLGPPPFFTVPIKRIGFNSDDASDVGFVKFCTRKVPLALALVPGKVEKIDAEQQALYNRMDHLCTEPPLDELSDRLKGPPDRVLVRLYVLRGASLRPTNSAGLADPYIIAELGTRKQGERKDAINGTLYPPFFRMFEFKPQLPGAGLLKVHIYSANQSLLATDGDELIGSTEIDLEDRWYSELYVKKYQENPPLERRTLRMTREGGTQGTLEVIVEMMLQPEAARRQPLVITPPPPEMVELRVVIWQARKMENKKTLLAQNDLFFKVLVQGTDRLGKVFLQEKSTDIHWFSSGGTGSFNYRLTWRFELPLSNPRLKISAWNKDVVGTVDDTIGEYTEPLSRKCGELLTRLKQVRASGNKTDDVEIVEPTPDLANKGRKWVSLKHPSNKYEVKGEVEIQFSLLTVKKAEARPVGEGQDEPNRDPPLPRPDRVTLNLLGALRAPPLTVKRAVAKRAPPDPAARL